MNTDDLRKLELEPASLPDIYRMVSDKYVPATIADLDAQHTLIKQIFYRCNRGDTPLAAVKSELSSLLQEVKRERSARSAGQAARISR